MIRSSRTPAAARVGRLAVTSGLAVALLSACGSSGVRPGAAALVGDQRITATALQQIVTRGLEDPQAEEQLGQDRPAFQRQALARLINRELLEEAADREGVTVDDGDVDLQLERFSEQAGGREALETQAAQSGISKQDLPQFLRDVVLDQALGDELTEDLDVPQDQLQQLYDQNIGQYDRVRSRHILVAEEDRARSILAEVEQDPSRFAALAAEFSTDESNKDDGGDLGLVGRGQFVPEFEKLLFSAEPGSYDVVKTEFGWHVVNVLERQTTSLEEATPELRRGVLQQQRQQATQELLREVASDVGVKVNPRFGRWDGATGAVEALDDPNDVTTPGADESAAPAAPGEEPPAADAPPAPEEEAPLIEEVPEGAPEPAPSPAG